MADLVNTYNQQQKDFLNSFLFKSYIPKPLKQQATQILERNDSRSTRPLLLILAYLLVLIRMNTCVSCCSKHIDVTIFLVIEYVFFLCAITDVVTGVVHHILVYQLPLLIALKQYRREYHSACVFDRCNVKKIRLCAVWSACTIV